MVLDGEANRVSHSVIVVPCYNEAERLQSEQFLDFARQHDQIKFVMVDDGSLDSTAQILASMQSQLPDRIVAVSLPENAGKAEAVRRGILKAIEMNADYVGFWDADLATPLEAIPDFAAVLDRRLEIETVIGSRMPLLGRRVERDLMRWALSRAFAKAGSIVLGERIYDTQCGAKMFRVTPVTRTAFQDEFVVRWTFDVELLARLVRLWRENGGGRFTDHVFEYPLDRWTEMPGSKLKSKDFLKAGYELYSVFWRYLGPFRIAMRAVPKNVEEPVTERRAA